MITSKVIYSSDTIPQTQFLSCHAPNIPNIFETGPVSPVTGLEFGKLSIQASQQPHLSTCLHLPSTGIRSIPYYAYLFPWVLRVPSHKFRCLLKVIQDYGACSVLISLSVAKRLYLSQDWTTSSPLWIFHTNIPTPERWPSLFWKPLWNRAWYTGHSVSQLFMTGKAAALGIVGLKFDRFCFQVHFQVLLFLARCFKESKRLFLSLPHCYYHHHHRCHHQEPLIALMIITLITAVTTIIIMSWTLSPSLSSSDHHHQHHYHRHHHYDHGHYPHHIIINSYHYHYCHHRYHHHHRCYHRHHIIIPTPAIVITVNIFTLLVTTITTLNAALIIVTASNISITAITITMGFVRANLSFTKAN